MTAVLEEKGGQTIGIRITAEYEEAVSPSWLREVAGLVLREEGKKGPLEMSVVITGDSETQELNRQFRGTDAATDVLAFPSGDDSHFAGSGEVPPYLGDVIVSYPRAKEQACEQGHATQVELAILVIHGILHLLGYDDEEVGARELMWSRQQEILDGLGL